MKTLTSVSRRENFLIAVYQENNSRSFNAKKFKLRNRANRLLNELRSRYGFSIEIKQVDIDGDYNTITQNGRYALD